MLQAQGQSKAIGANRKILTMPHPSRLANWLPEAGASGYFGYWLSAIGEAPRSTSAAGLSVRSDKNDAPRRMPSLVHS
jgi:hypothetical protein